MRIAIMGAGAVGGYFGGKLALAGQDVTFIARGAHGAAIANEGLRVNSPGADFHVRPVKVAADASTVGPVDAVMFSVKMTDAAAAATALKPLLGDATTVFCFQNGVEVVDHLAPIVGRERIVPGVAMISATIGGPGVIAHAGSFARLVFGEADGHVSARCEAFFAALQAAKVDSILSTDIGRELWLKFLMLAPFAGITSLTRSTMGPVRDNPRTRQLTTDLVQEIFALAQKLDVGLRQSDVTNLLGMLDAFPAGSKASMAHDLEIGKPLELPFLSGAVVRLGEKHGVPTPAHAFVCAGLALQEKGRSSPA